MIFVLNEVQMLDQEIAAPRPVAQQKFNLLRGLGIDLAPFGGRFGSLSSLARMFEGADLLHIMTHRNVSVLLAMNLVCGMPDAKRNDWAGWRAGSRRCQRYPRFRTGSGQRRIPFNQPVFAGIAEPSITGFQSARLLFQSRTRS